MNYSKKSNANSVTSNVEFRTVIKLITQECVKPGDIKRSDAENLPKVVL